MRMRTFLFNLQEDPLELTNLIYQNPEKYQELTNDLMQWRDALPAKGKAGLGNPRGAIYVNGAAKNSAVDPRYKIAGEDSAAIAYPAPIQSPGAP